jgi:integrase
MKGGKAHKLPITPAMAAILEATPGVGDAVFGKGKGFDNFGPAKRDLDARAAEIAGAPIRDWHLHDLRRTVRTALTGKLGIAENVAEAVIAHARPGVRGVYDVNEYFDERRAALTRWASYLDAIVTGDERRSAKVVPLRESVPA